MNTFILFIINNMETCFSDGHFVVFMNHFQIITFSNYSYLSASRGLISINLTSFVPSFLCIEYQMLTKYLIDMM